MNLKDRDGEELMASICDSIHCEDEDFFNEVKAELLSRLAAGEKAIAELKTAKLDSARLIVQEEMYENSKCCGNCDRWYSKTTCPHFNEQQRPSDYCPQWKPDQLIRSERGIK